MRIDPNIDDVLNEFNLTYFSGYSGEISHVKAIDKAVFFSIRNEDEKIELEKRLDTIIDIKLDFSKERVYAIVGSKIDSFNVVGWYYDEITGEKTELYKTFIDYEKEFNGNMIYFYWIDNEDYYFSDHYYASSYSGK